jgi:hypothetical protein
MQRKMFWVRSFVTSSPWIGNLIFFILCWGWGWRLKGWMKNAKAVGHAADMNDVRR